METHGEQMKALITGTSGLLGSEIMSQKPESICLTSKDCDLTESNHSILNIESGRIDTVIHCAAKVGGVKANIDYVADFFDSNVKMNMNVLEACRKKHLKLISVLSTCIYPDAIHVKYPLTEDQLHLGPPHPSNFGYAYSKRMLEVQSRAYRQQFGCDFITVIPNSLYGLNDNFSLESGHVIPALIRKFHEAKLHNRDQVEIWGSGKPIREFTFASDAAQIILWLAENYNEETPVNIGNPEQISIENLAILISNEFDYDGDIIFDNSKPDGQFQKPSSNDYLRSLGWKKDYTPIEQGLKETILFFKKNYPNLRGIEK